MWLWILEEFKLWPGYEKRRLREDGCVPVSVDEVSGCKKSGCLKGYGGWKDRCEYRGGCWK